MAKPKVDPKVDLVKLLRRMVSCLFQDWGLGRFSCCTITLTKNLLGSFTINAILGFEKVARAFLSSQWLRWLSFPN